LNPGSRPRLIYVGPNRRSAPEERIVTHALCPAAGKRGKPVPLVTLRSLVLPEHAAVVEGREWFFCSLPDCEVVYFTHDGQTLEKNALKVRVGLKEKEAPRPACYCFGHSVESIREEIEKRGRSTVVASIRDKVEAGECSCEVLNPKGTCCLGDVNNVVKEALASNEAPRAEGTEPLAAAERAIEGGCRATAGGAGGEREVCRLQEPVVAGHGHAGRRE